MTSPKFSSRACTRLLTLQMGRICKLSILLAAFVLLSLFPQAAYANEVLVPVVLIGAFTTVTAIRTFGIALLAVILIEALILRRREQLGYVQAFKISSLANLLSTFIGAGVAFWYSLGTFFFLGVLIGAAIMTWFASSFLNRTGYAQTSTPWWIGSYIGWVAGGIGGCTLGALTIPGHSYYPVHRLSFSESELVVAVFAAVGLLLLGFLGSVVSEGYVVARYIPNRKKVLSTVLLMNTISYVALLVASSPFISATIIERGWFHHPSVVPADLTPAKWTVSW